MSRKNKEKLCDMAIIRATRDLRPSHFSIKIKSYSILETCKTEKYESGIFEVGDHKWRLCLYPKGDKKRNGDGHISLYLAIADTNGLPLGWEVNVNFRFFVYDHILDKYLVIQDSEGSVRRLHDLNTECGFAQLLSLGTFKDASNGYLFDDCCVFGAEVFVLKPSFKSESFTMVKSPKNGTFTWKISKFSTQIDKEFYDSGLFTVGERQWKLRVCPKGNSVEKGKSLSLYLYIIDPPEQKVYADYCFVLKDQLNGNHIKKEASDCWFSSSGDDGWGFHEIVSLDDLSDVNKGYIKSDVLIIEVQFSAVSLTS